MWRSRPKKSRKPPTVCGSRLPDTPRREQWQQAERDLWWLAKMIGVIYAILIVVMLFFFLLFQIGHR